LERHFAELIESGLQNRSFHQPGNKQNFSPNWIQSPECQELSVPVVGEPLVTVKSSETQNVDLKVGTNKVGTNHYFRHLTDKVGTNHYLRHFEHRSSLHPINRTGSFRYMSDETSEGAQLQGYMLECVHHQETQRIRTVTNFFRRSTVPSEDVFSSSVTNVTDSRVLSSSHSPLKIAGKRHFFCRSPLGNALLSSSFGVSGLTVVVETVSVEAF
jgi:hypothetical protein